MEDQMKKHVLMVSMMSVLVIAGCGGGYGSSGYSSTMTTSTAFPAQGSWTGTSSNNYTLQAVILETGEFFNILSSGNIVYSVDHGTLTASSGYTYSYISGSLSEFYPQTNSESAGTVTGTYVATTSISETVQITGGSSVTLTGSYDSQYGTPASLPALAGTYTGAYYLGGPLVTLSISSTGVINGTSTNCAISGTAVPRSSGANVFNVSLTLTGANCTPAGVSSTTGIAVLNTTNGLTYLYTAGLDPAGTNGFFWIGQK